MPARTGSRRFSHTRRLAALAAAGLAAVLLNGCIPLQYWPVCADGRCGVLPDAGDATPPAAPRGLVASAGDGSVLLRWSRSPEPDLRSYRVYRATAPDGRYRMVAERNQHDREHWDTEVVNGTTYRYFVTATDINGNESSGSAEASATPSAGRRALEPPSGVVATAGDAQVRLQWRDSPGAFSYHVHRSQASGGPYVRLGETITRFWEDRDLENGTTYHYVVTAEDFDEREESAHSDEVSATPMPRAELLTRWGRFGTADGELRGPQGIAADPTGTVHVADSGNHRIQTFGSSGAFVAGWGGFGTGAGRLAWPRGIAVSRAGEVYVADSGNHRIQRFTASGQLVGGWGGLGSADGMFRTPTGIAIDAQDNVYVADTGNGRIQKFTAEGQFVAGWAGDASTRALRPAGVAVDPAGHVYVTDLLAHRVLKLGSAGVVLTSWGERGSAPGQLASPQGIAADGHGRVLVADTGNDRVQVFTRTGALSSVLGDTGPQEARLDAPTAVTTDCRANVYVVDTGRSRIQKFGNRGAAPPPCPPRARGSAMRGDPGARASASVPAPGTRAFGARRASRARDRVRPTSGARGSAPRREARDFAMRPAHAARARRRPRSLEASFALTQITRGRVLVSAGRVLERGMRASGTFRARLGGADVRGPQVSRPHRFARGTWRARLDAAIDPLRREGTATGTVLATFEDPRAGRLCLRLRTRYTVSPAGAATMRGSLRALGGTRASRRLRVRGSYTQRSSGDRAWTAHARGRAVAGARRGMPARCRRGW